MASLHGQASRQSGPVPVALLLVPIDLPVPSDRSIAHERSSSARVALAGNRTPVVYGPSRSRLVRALRRVPGVSLLVRVQCIAGYARATLSRFRVASVAAHGRRQARRLFRTSVAPLRRLVPAGRPDSLPSSQGDLRSRRRRQRAVLYPVAIRVRVLSPCTFLAVPSRAGRRFPVSVAVDRSRVTSQRLASVLQAHLQAKRD